MLRIEEIVGNVDDDFRDHLLEMDDTKLRALLADSQTLRHLLPMGVSYREAVTVINAILEYRAPPPEEAPAPAPPAAKKPRAPRKKKPVPEAQAQPVPEEAILPPPPQAEEPSEMKAPPLPEPSATPEPEPEPEPVLPPLPEGEGRAERELASPAPEPVPEHPESLPPLKPRWRDHIILILPVMLAAALVILLLSR